MSDRLRNPGPSWGFRFLRVCDQLLPEPLFLRLRALGTWVAVATMPQERKNSRDYLRIVLGHEPSGVDVFGHFFACCESLMRRLRVANGREHHYTLSGSSGDFGRWMDSGDKALLGTFHIGDSDLAGFMLAGRRRKRMSLVRMRVGNSHDTDALAARFGEWLRFVWVNDPGEILFALKEAGETSDALALQCDRAEYSSREEAFDFLGDKRRFPFAIYYLSLIFERQVLLAFGDPSGPASSLLHASPAFVPVPGEPREQALERARAHFQSFLGEVEAYLRSHPFQWLNFRPL